MDNLKFRTKLIELITLMLEPNETEHLGMSKIMDENTSEVTVNRFCGNHYFDDCIVSSLRRLEDDTIKVSLYDTYRKVYCDATLNELCTENLAMIAKEML